MIAEEGPIDPVIEAMLRQRPRTRAECPPVVDGRRCCPWVGCKHHMGVDVGPRGTITEFSDEPWELEWCCSLDLAEDRELSLDEVGQLMGDLSRERIRQIQGAAMVKVRAAIARWGLSPDDILDWLDTSEAVRCRGQIGDSDAKARPAPTRQPRLKIETGVGRHAVARFVAAVADAPEHGYTIAEIAQKLQRSYTYAATLASAALARGEVCRVARGHYGPAGAAGAVTPQSGKRSTVNMLAEALEKRGAATAEDLAGDLGITRRRADGILQDFQRCGRVTLVDGGHPARGGCSSLWTMSIVTEARIREVARDAWASLSKGCEQVELALGAQTEPGL